ncbi:ABC transporter permease [Brevundimonas sp. GN22]
MAIRKLLSGFRDFAFVLLATVTVLFFLLRLTGDPAIVLAGEGATADQIQAIRVENGFDKPLVTQFVSTIFRLAQGDFGKSLLDGTPAMEKVLAALPATLMLAAMAITLNLIVSLPLGAWLGQSQTSRSRKAVRAFLSVLQGFPGFVIALLLINLFAASLEWLPSIGFSGPATWILPVVSVVCFLAPKLTRVVEANTWAALNANFVRTARSIGASDNVILWRHVLPNSLLGAVALIGAEIAFMLTGLVVIETIFAWPGIGWLLVQSTLNLDFPVVQAVVIVMVISVFLSNALTEAVQVILDPRIRVGARADK